MINSLISSENFSKYQNVKSLLISGDSTILSDVDITVVMPIFNHHRFLKEAIQSILNQKTKKKYAILIVDNDSECKYGNEEIINIFDNKQIVYYRNEKNIGAAGNWNRCIELCKSRYFTFLHDDDMFKDSTIETLFNIKQLTKADFVFSSFDIINEKNEIVLSNQERSSYRYITLEDMLMANYCHTGEAVLFDRELLIKLGGYSEKFIPCFDYALYTKIVYEYKAVKYLKPIFDYRRAENDTFSCYDKIPITDDLIRKFIISKLKYPKGLMLIYNKIKLKDQMSLYKRIFGFKNIRRHEGVNILELVLLKLVEKFIILRSSQKSKIIYL